MQYYRFPQKTQYNRKDNKHLQRAIFLADSSGICLCPPPGAGLDDTVRTPIMRTVPSTSAIGDLSIRFFYLDYITDLPAPQQLQVLLNEYRVPGSNKWGGAFYYARVLAYENNYPSIIAVPLERQENTGDPYEQVVLFFKININSLEVGDPLNTVVLLDYIHKETSTDPNFLNYITGTQVDRDNNILFVSYFSRIVAIDYSDIDNISKVAEYDMPVDSNRLNHIRNFEYDKDKSVFVFSTNNQNNMYDTINIVYYSFANKIFAHRGSFYENRSFDYRSLKINNNYIYAVNANYIDTGGQDSLRDKLGIHVLHNTQSDYTVIERVNILPYDEYWNDSKMPIEYADKGYIKRANAFYEIAAIENDTLYAYALSTSIESSGKTKCVSPGLNGLVMYDLSTNPRGPTIIGSKRIRDNAVDIPNSSAAGIEDYDRLIFFDILKDDRLTGIKTIIETEFLATSQMNTPGHLYRIHLYETSAIDLYQNIDSLDDRFYDITYKIPDNSLTPDIIAIAQGSAGVKVMYHDSSSSQYVLLAQLRPEYNGEYKSIKFVEWYDIYQGILDTLICGGEDGIVFNYNFDISTSKFTLAQTIDTISEIGATDILAAQIKNSQIQTTWSNTVPYQSSFINIPIEIVKTR